MNTYTKLFIVLLVICAWINAPTTIPRPSDENIYFLMARDTLRGRVPYQDFFFAHPPVMLIILTTFFMLLGTTWMTGTAVAMVVNVSLLAVCFRLARRYYNDRAALMSCALLLSSQGFLMSGQTDGNVLALLFAIAAIERHNARRPLPAGILCGIAVLTKLFTVVTIPVILFDLRKRRGAATTFLLAFLAVTVPVGCALAYIAGPHQMVEQMVLFHMQKEPFPLEVRTRVLKNFLLTEALIVIAAIPSLIERGRERPRAFLGFFTLVTLLILIQKRIFLQYLIFPLVPLAVFAGGTLDRWSSWGKSAEVLIVAMLVAAFFWNAPHYSAARTGHPFGLALLKYSQYVSTHSNPDERVFGHAIAAPTLAFLSGLEISGNELDSNYVRVTSGVMAPERLIEAVSIHRTRYIVLVAKRTPQSDGDNELHFSGIGNDPAFRKYVLDGYVLRAPVLHYGKYDAVTLFENRDMISAEELNRAQATSG
ncbi:MAG: glycosyltransferase family 39 protein [Candidatus Undinarchaeales archaeon]|jgi:4-amino-4-deoxy-L-arabinose transferase-like glycosyltransferase|nr:glycosyltransferase family 39 protein [Candidatus Undinarchaeales archaeon]MDP7491965.1 glycosyltransferase family 39 protein [Candidatus Undinarchaeales archaeon]